MFLQPNQRTKSSVKIFHFKSRSVETFFFSLTYFLHYFCYLGDGIAKKEKLNKQTSNVNNLLPLFNIHHFHYESLRRLSNGIVYENNIDFVLFYYIFFLHLLSSLSLVEANFQTENKLLQCKVCCEKSSNIHSGNLAANSQTYELVYKRTRSFSGSFSVTKLFQRE